MSKTFVVGDLVYPAPGVGWGRGAESIRHVITKVPKRANEKNFYAAPADKDGVAIPGAQGIKGPAHALIPESEYDGAASTFAPNPPVSSVVRPSSPGLPEGVYVVTGETDHQRVRIMLMGGDGRTYWRVYSNSLTVLDPAEVQAALAGL